MNKIINLFAIIFTIALCTNVTSVFASTDQADYKAEEASSSIVLTDVSSLSPAYNAIMNVAQAGLMTGYGDGTFKPHNNISRAEFTSIICKLAGVDREAQKITRSVYNDVPDSHWAVGRIAKATELGIISGYGNGLFGPSDNVLYEQAIKMIVCEEADTSNVESKGGYPDGYISIASGLNYLEGVSYNKKNAATRENIAVMLNNVLQSRENAFVTVEDDSLSVIID